MGEMLKTISEPREDYKPFVPRIVQIRIASEFIGAVIGKGGETIQKIQKETGTTITIDEQPKEGGAQGETEGIVDIFGTDKQAMDAALEWIKGICAVPEPGQVYHGRVVSILEFGAFVEILPGKEGLLHVSEIAWNKTENVEDVLKVGDEIDVKLLEIDAKTGKMRLSMRALTDKPEGYVEPKRPERGGRGGNGNGNGNGRGGDRGPRGGNGNGRGGERGGHNGGERRGERPERNDRPERGERPERGGDRGPRRTFGPKREAPAPTIDDYREPTDEMF
jgi:polyribonucleotide nucleotidyltransferase